MSTPYETHLEQTIKNQAQEISGLKFMNDQQAAKIAQLKESEDDLNEQVRCQAAAITRHLAQRDADRDHIDDLTQQVKSLQAALDERDEELEDHADENEELLKRLEALQVDTSTEAAAKWPASSEEDPDTRTNQLINALYHDRARLEKALKHGAFLANQYKDVLAERIKLTDKEGKEHPDLVYASGLLSEWCHVNG